MRKLIMLVVFAIGVSFAHPFVDNLFTKSNTISTECNPAMLAPIQEEFPEADVQCGIYSWSREMYLMDFSNVGADESPFTFQQNGSYEAINKIIRLDDGTIIFLAFIEKDKLVVAVSQR